jgi:hypothetical protein
VQNYINKECILAGHGWSMPIILATWETEIRRIKAGCQPGQIVCMTQSWKFPTQKRAGRVAQLVIYLMAGMRPWVQLPPTKNFHAYWRHDSNPIPPKSIHQYFLFNTKEPKLWRQWVSWAVQQSHGPRICSFTLFVVLHFDMSCIWGGRLEIGKDKWHLCNLT